MEDSQALYGVERKALYEKLHLTSPRLAGVYRRLIRLLEEPPDESERLVRASLIGHCVRELINRLPDVLADVPDMIAPVSPKSSDLVQKLPNLFERHADLMVSGTIESIADEPQAIQMVPLPRPLFDMLQRITDASARETARSLERDAIAVARAKSASGPTYDRWRVARKFFMDFTHLDNHVGQDERPIPSEEQILDHLRVIETAVSTRLNAFFDNRHLLDEFLAEANALATDGSTAYRQPDPLTVRDILARIGSLQLRRIFYQGLQNPQWVLPLFNEGAFKPPPDPKQDMDGNIREEPWPEMEYLARMAPESSTDVVNVALMLVKSKNSWIKRGLVEICSIVQADQGARLARQMRQLWAGDFGWRTDPRHLALMTEHLLGGGEYSLGLKVAADLFQPRKPKARSTEQATYLVGLEDYWYEDLLPQVACALGDGRLVTLISWLESYERLTGDDGDDWSYLRRPDIGSREPGFPGVKEGLTDAVRDAARQQMSANPIDSVAHLLRSKHAVVKRICLFVAAEVLATARPEAVDDVVSATLPLLGRPEFGQSTFRVEFAAFLRAMSARAGADKLLLLVPTLEAGPLGSAELLKERLRPMELDDGQDLDMAAEEYTRRWKHRLLASVGSDLLPDVLREELKNLDARFGAIENPRSADMTVTTWSGPTSPRDHSVMEAMEGGELLTYLRGWHASPDGWRSPSHQGQGLELTTAVSSHPDIFDNCSDQVMHLRPTYLRAVLRGWENALNDKKTLPWETAVAVIQRTLALPDEAPFELEGMDDDKDYRPAKAAAVSLSAALIRTRGEVTEAPQPEVESLTPTIIGLVTSPQLRQDYESSSGDSMGPYTLSVNRPYPKAIRGLIALTSWQDRLEADSPLARTLSDLLEIDDPHGAVSAVFGESLARLYTHGHEWLQANSRHIFGGEQGQSRQQEIALSTALATHNVHPMLLEVLREPIKCALGRAEPLASGGAGLRTPAQLVGDWIVVLHIWGYLGMEDELLRLFFESAPPQLRGNVMGHIGFEFMHADSVEPQILNTAGELWDARAAHVRDNPIDAEELGDFYWFVKSGKFSPAWWAPRLSEALKLSPRRGIGGMVYKPLAHASLEYPDLILDIAKALLSGWDDAKGDLYMLVEEALPQIIASALDAGDPALGANATALMHEAGEHGHIDMETKVAELRRR
ncbi:hypothetical protein AB0284_17210 [Pseudarthrobacter phenanthrenivorans]|uniref:hypothetical protein n=1 Tax=Pseudarthrobacter phenanthrenivorans TaxID=361575 RepID=UPI0034502131